jgi:sugar O-acyltransferase (sialic acid O-acetyltransferase NeuD family)
MRTNGRLVIFGGPGSGALVAQTVSALTDAGHPVELTGFLNDVIPAKQEISGVPVLGDFASWRELPEEVMFIAPLHKAMEMPVRAEIVRGLGVPEHRWSTIIDPRSAVARDTVIAPGCFVGPFATIGPGACLGAHCAVRAGAHVSHDCRVGDFVFVGMNAVVCGCTVIKDGAYLAPGATIRDRCQVGNFAVVGLGAVVTQSVAGFDVVAGSPARQVRRR